MVAAARATHAAQGAPLLSVRGLVKQLGGTLAVNNVDFDVASGEIHALLGANGAGKTTLIKVLAGIYRPDRGEITLDGRPLASYGGKAPIAFIHQELGLVSWMTVAENIALVRGYDRRGALIDWRQVRQAAQQALELLGSDIDPEARISSLSRADRSLVAIARALALDAELLVLDEPTASLPESEVARLFAALRRLVARGYGMIYVSHRLDEIYRIADRVTVLRDGRNVGTRAVRETTPDDLVLMIVGRPVGEVFVSAPEATARPMLEVEDLRVGAVGPVSFRVMAGEIVALAGLRGAGQSAVGRALAGILPIDSGRLRLDGAPFIPGNSRQATGAGVVFATSNREEESLAMPMTVAENLFLNPAVRKRRLWQARPRGVERRAANALVETFSIRPPDPERAVATLSGGNQQKVVLARWLGTGERLLILEEPTAGVDVGSKADIYAMLDDELRHGTGIIMVSSDFDEVAGVCHRALVFNRGRITAEIPHERLSVATLTAMAAGAATETGDNR
ncbi:MAG: sugar ABC transporter ATP-binding protein [Thermomicrobiales bacterium]|nr:sugar ABC transporter ATP-binding protein [Thermomicrobiales bacterium]